MKCLLEHFCQEAAWNGNWRELQREECRRDICVKTGQIDGKGGDGGERREGELALSFAILGTN